LRISHEAIYQSLYIQGRGALKRELVCVFAPDVRCTLPENVPAARPGRT
jgi:hypothetical protein